MGVRNIAVAGATTFFLLVLTPTTSFEAAVDAAAKGGVLWHDPRGRVNLFYGSGSEAKAPRGPFRFFKEDTSGSSPKFIVRDREGNRWKVKLGPESQAEVAASRLVWAAGYYTHEDYLIPELHLETIPNHLKRHKLIEEDGVMRNASMKRESGEKKLGDWKWADNPFRDSREWNGLRVMMALLNNWDVKDVNNGIYKHDGERIYMVSDLGASFGAPGRSFPADKSKNNLDEYRQSEFICGEPTDVVNFCAPSRASIAHLVDPLEFRRRLGLRWVGRDIPRADAKWIGGILGRLSPNQIRDAFRAGGYSPADIEGFATVIERRIAELNAL
jgi:hypothetical protein